MTLNGGFTSLEAAGMVRESTHGEGRPLSSIWQCRLFLEAYVFGATTTISKPWDSMVDCLLFIGVPFLPTTEQTSRR
jgi:hypothetical protein